MTKTSQRSASIPERPDQTNSRSATVATAKTNRILPATPTTKQVSKPRDQRETFRREVLSLRDAYGVLGVPMILTLVICIGWTSWLIVVAIAPNEAANWLMGTGAFDNGQFWLITDTNPTVIKAGIVALVFINVCYVFVLTKMLRWRKNVAGIIALQLVEMKFERISSSSSLTCSRAKRICLHAHSQFKELTSFRGADRKYWNVLLKVLNLTMQIIVLLELLDTGNPQALVYAYTAFISVGSMAGALKILIGTFSAMTEVAIGSVFDLFAAVVYPIGVLVYCYYNFQFDDAVFATYLKILPPGSFERSARVFADPSEIAFFRLAFDSLRIRSMLDFALRVGISLSFCYRIMRAGDVLIAAHLRHVTLGRDPKVKPISRRQKAVPKSYAVAFITCSVMVWVFSVQAMQGSQERCSQYPECVVYAYRWASSDGKCPCRIIINVNPAPMTYEEWIHPIDVYDNIKELAASGELRSLQLINRQLLELPEELRACRYLMSITLIYTGILSIPTWAQEFKYLETLHLEGKQGSRNLLALPGDLFSDMPWLSMVHIGVHLNLSNIPAFNGVPNLKTLTLARLFAIRELPSLSLLPRLEKLVLTFLPQLERMPSMAPLQGLEDFTLSRPTRLCCNGFRGECDLNDSYCIANPSVGMTASVCVSGKPFEGSAGTRSVFDKFASSVCQKLPSDGMLLEGVPMKATIDICNGRLFGECQLPSGITGICYNTRMQVLSCYGDENYIKLRRYQIQLRVGPACDPSIEKWLGCP